MLAVIAMATTSSAGVSGDGKAVVTAVAATTAAVATASRRIGREPLAHRVRPASDQDAGQRAQSLGHRDELAGAHRRPVAYVHQQHQREGARRELRDDQQRGRAVDAPQHVRAAVRVRRGPGRRLGRTRRVGREQRDQYGDHTADHGQEADGAAQAVRGRQRRHRQGRDAHAQRGRRLADAHRQAALLRREPAHHQAAARRVHGRACRAGHDQQQAERHHAVGGPCRARQRRGRPAQAGRDHHALAPAVGCRAPQVQGQYEAGGRRRDQQAHVREREVVVLAEGVREVGDAVHERAGGRLGGRSQGQHQPAAHRGDLHG